MHDSVESVGTRALHDSVESVGNRGLRDNDLKSAAFEVTKIFSTNGCIS